MSALKLGRRYICGSVCGVRPRVIRAYLYTLRSRGRRINASDSFLALLSAPFYHVAAVERCAVLCVAQSILLHMRLYNVLNSFLWEVKAISVMLVGVGVKLAIHVMRNRVYLEKRISVMVACHLCASAEPHGVANRAFRFRSTAWSVLTTCNLLRCPTLPHFCRED